MASNEIIVRIVVDCAAFTIGFITTILACKFALARSAAAHRREVEELRECIARRSSYLNAILQKALELGNDVPIGLRKVMDGCIVAEDEAIGFGVFSTKKESEQYEDKQ